MLLLLSYTCTESTVLDFPILVEQLGSVRDFHINESDVNSDHISVEKCVETNAHTNKMSSTDLIVSLLLLLLALLAFPRQISCDLNRTLFATIIIIVLCGRFHSIYGMF